MNSRDGSDQGFGGGLNLDGIMSQQPNHEGNIGCFKLPHEAMLRSHWNWTEQHKSKGHIDSLTCGSFFSTYRMMSIKVLADVQLLWTYISQVTPHVTPALKSHYRCQETPPRHAWLSFNQKKTQGPTFYRFGQFETVNAFLGGQNCLAASSREVNISFVSKINGVCESSPPCPSVEVCRVDATSSTPHTVNLRQI